VSARGGMRGRRGIPSRWKLPSSSNRVSSSSFGSLPEADPLVQIVAEDSSLGNIALVAFAGSAKGKGEQEPEVESIQENDALRP